MSYLEPGDTITTFFLYQSAGTLDLNEPEAVAYPNALDPTSSPDSVTQRFRQLDFASDYELIWNLDAGQYYIFFPQRLQNIQSTTIAYQMIVKKGNGSTLTFGDLTGEKFQLQMLKRANPHPSDPLWDAEWKNVYNLGRQNIEYDYFVLDVFKGYLGDEDNPTNRNYQSTNEYYIRMLGLDQYNSTGQHVPDNKVDDDPAVFDTMRGLLIFPDRYPFASDDLDEPVPGLYASSNPNDLRDSSKYYIRFDYEVYDLGHPDIVDGSLRVSVDGEAIVGGYQVDLARGKLWLTNDSAYVPDADVEACFDYWK